MKPADQNDAARSPSRPVLYLLCGKVGAGKSTLANDLAARPGRTVRALFRAAVT
jgi:adenylylsulfate kinase-like enzyme